MHQHHAHITSVAIHLPHLLKSQGVPSTQVNLLNHPATLPNQNAQLPLMNPPSPVHCPISRDGHQHKPQAHTWASRTSRASPCMEARKNTRLRRLGTPKAAHSALHMHKGHSVYVVCAMCAMVCCFALPDTPLETSLFTACCLQVVCHLRPSLYRRRRQSHEQHTHTKPVFVTAAPLLYMAKALPPHTHLQTPPPCTPSCCSPSAQSGPRSP